MAKEVQMSIKMERDLREAFLAAAAREHRPAAQIVREMMRDFIERTPAGRGDSDCGDSDCGDSACREERRPNAETIAAMRELENGGGFRANNVEELCRELGIPCEK